MSVGNSAFRHLGVVMKKGITTERAEELLDFAEATIEDKDHLDYFNWDCYIEEGMLSTEELDWLRENYRVLVVLAPKD